MPSPSSDRFQLFADGVKDYAFIQIDTDNRITDWNTGAMRLLGYTEEEAIGQSAAMFFTPEDRAAKVPQHEIRLALENGTAEDERWHLRKDGSRFRASGVLTKLCDDDGSVVGFAKVFRDVTERELARERLQRSLIEKDALLREIHHRVKNNLQVIVSLLNLQSRYINDPQALTYIEETTNRVRAISRIHETLYGASDLASVPFSSYLHQLVVDLTAFYDVAQRIRTDVQATPVTLDIEHAVPLALITNELVCNAMKHAFPGGVAGSVTVTLATAPEWATLTVCDSGVGLPVNFDPQTSGGLGFNLIRILSEQIGADLQIHTDGGASMSVRFPLT
jgi:PAS domain S-box-containing protein